MAANILKVVFPPPPSRNPVDQDLVWIGFSTEVNRNIIRYEGGPDVFNDFVGLTEIDIWDMDSGFSKRTNVGKNKYCSF